MLKNPIRITSTIFASILLAATLAGCANNAPSSSTAPVEQASSQSATQNETITQSETTTTTVAAEAATTSMATPKLNLNTVSGEELLATIPGFGNRMVREFQEYRPYVSIQQFRKEIGKYVDAAQVAEYEKYVYVPINVNESDADSLKQIPGVDDAKTQELIAARPYASPAAFLEKLATLVSADDAALAKGYVEGQ